MMDTFDRADRQVGVEDVVRRRLAESCYFSCRPKQIECEYRDGVLTLRGRVPSFYLKQMAQTVLKEINGVERIDNQVDVVSSTGLSSARTR